MRLWMSVLYKKNKKPVVITTTSVDFSATLTTKESAAMCTQSCISRQVNISEGYRLGKRWVREGMFRCGVFGKGRGYEGCGGQSVGVSGSGEALFLAL